MKRYTQKVSSQACVVCYEMTYGTLRENDTYPCGRTATGTVCLECYEIHVLSCDTCAEVSFHESA
jgi:hypothetical protein